MHKAYNIVQTIPPTPAPSLQLLYSYPYLIPFDVFHRRLKTVTAFTKNGLVRGTAVRGGGLGGGDGCFVIKTTWGNYGEERSINVSLIRGEILKWCEEELCGFIPLQQGWTIFRKIKLRFWNTYSDWLANTGHVVLYLAGMRNPRPDGRFCAKAAWFHLLWF